MMQIGYFFKSIAMQNNEQQYNPEANSWLQEFKDCKHLSREEAEIINNTLDQLAICLLEVVSQKSYIIDNQCFVSLSKEENKAA